MQSLPPSLGAGLVHVRVRNLVPVPQDFVHSENSVHCEKPPSTVKSAMNSKVLFTGNAQQGTKREMKLNTCSMR